jgi:hypothetical protein
MVVTQPARTPLGPAYRELLTSLYYAQEKFHHSGDAGREGFKLACRAVAHFLRRRGENPELAAPFMTVMEAFNDLAHPSSNSVWTGTSESQHSRSRNKKHIACVAAACLETLIHAGMDVDLASKKVARAVGKWPTMSGQPAAVTIQNWRNQQRALLEIERRQFDLMCADLKGRRNVVRAVEAFLRNPSIGLPKTSKRTGP